MSEATRVDVDLAKSVIQVTPLMLVVNALPIERLVTV